jgi:acyl-CoA synthetase (NDP forming)
MVEKEGMVLAQLSAATHRKLEKTLPRAANILNPVDVLGDALSDRFREAVNDVLAEKQVNAVVVIVTPQIMTEIEATAKLIGELSAKYNKPIVCSFMGGSSIAVGERVLNAYKIPSFRFPERAVKALAAMWRWRQFAMRQSQADRIKTTTPIFARPKYKK